MAYSIRLVGLECFKTEELGGDAIYLKLNGEKVWESNPDKLGAHFEDSAWVSQFDFAGGRKLTSLGWVALTPYNPEAFIFKDQTGGAVLQLWETDTLTRDDLLGQTPIDAAQASGGNISVMFRRLGADYRLTYKVEDQG
ncbi:MAG: hypothetical protein GC204_14780 [Chloroflexi bacterium]|nr:hypothetical protein [Chloroflexota bacterium]